MVRLPKGSKKVRNYSKIFSVNPSENYNVPKVYQDLAPWHAPRASFLLNRSRIYEKYQSAAIVRNPFSRLYSAWNDKKGFNFFWFPLKFDYFLFCGY